MHRDMRMELSFGLGLYGVTMLLNYLFNLPEFVMGLLLGLTICFELIGILPETTYCNLKSKKKALWRKLIK